jgi:hypothetical protein
MVALLCRHLADTCLHVFTAADEPRNLQKRAGERVLRTAQAIRRARADRRLIGKAVYDRDTMLRSPYRPTEAGV